MASNANVDGLERWADACGLAMELIEDHSFRPGGPLILGTKNICDCHVPLGNGSRRVIDFEAEARHLRQQGWSEFKIRRSLEQKRQDSQRKVVKESEQAEGGPREWATFLQGAATRAKIKSTGIAYRMDGVRIDSKRAAGLRRETIASISLDAERLVQLTENVLYDITMTR